MNGKKAKQLRKEANYDVHSVTEYEILKRPKDVDIVVGTDTMGFPIIEERTVTKYVIVLDSQHPRSIYKQLKKAIKV